MDIFLENKKTTISNLEKSIKIKNFKIMSDKITFEVNCTVVTGFGERFDRLNQLGLMRKIHVYETFTNQNSDTYLPVPFFLTDAEFGLYIDIMEICTIETMIIENSVEFSIIIPSECDIYFFRGTPLNIIENFTVITGRAKLPPKWAFGLWISANRWNSQAIFEEQIEFSKKYDMKPSVAVLEAWSDEATFYLWNDEDKWPDPKSMIKKLHDDDIKLLLWQAPVLKSLSSKEKSEKHLKDIEYAILNDLIIRKKDGSPYKIPEGRWFSDGYVPDFTNKETCTWWFQNREYLLSLGVDGFKTDGGEFIYDDDTVFADGSTGREMKNGYITSYCKAYSEFTGEDRILFSRAGFTGSQRYSIHWAGDQMSTWKEFRSVLNAGLTAGLSGISFWGFDIAGFAGEFPGAELYLRAFAMACFCPVMQWHSQVIGGQFADILPSKDRLNDRSPWNVAKRHDNPEIIEICKHFVKVRYAILDYIYEEAKISAKTGRPLMAPLFLDWPDDKTTWDIADQYMFGRKLLVAPILYEGETERKIYLPCGVWKDFWSESRVEGNRWMKVSCPFDKIAVYELI